MHNLRMFFKHYFSDISRESKVIVHTSATSAINYVLNVAPL